MPRRTLLRLAVLLSLLTPLPALAQTNSRLSPAHAAVYHWHTLVLQNARPSDILKLMHWDHPATPPDPAPLQALPPTGLMPPTATLPAGVLRIFALQSNNSLLVQATDEGFATVTKLVQMFDIAPKQVQFKTLLVAVPATRAGLDAPNADASRFLAELLRGERRVIPTPLVTTTDGVGATISFSYPPPPIGGIRLIQAGPTAGRSDPSPRVEFRLTPRINADGTLTLGAAFGGLSVPTDRTLRNGEMTVYKVTDPQAASGERLFFFLRPTIIGESRDNAPANADGSRSVTVTP